MPYPILPKNPDPTGWTFTFAVRLVTDLQHCGTAWTPDKTKPCSPEIRQIRFVPLTDLTKYDLFSSDVRFLTEDLPRLEPTLARK